MLTLRRAMEMKAFQGADIVAGRTNIDKAINSVTVLEATNDDVVLWIQEHELFLTTFFSIADDEDQQIKMIEMLHSKNSTGLIVCSLGYWLKQLSPKVIEAAERLEFPLIVMPSQRTFYEIMFEIMKYLLDVQNEKLELALKVQRDMYSLLIGRKDISSLLVCLSSALKKAILYFDSDNKLAYKNTRTRIKEKNVVEILQSIVSDDIYNGSKGIYIDDTVYFPLVSFGDYYGMIIVMNVEDYEYEGVSLIVYHAILAIMLLSSEKKKMPHHDSWKLRNFLDDLLNKRMRSDSEIYSNADSLGFDLLDKHHLMVIASENDFSVGNLAIIKKRVQDDNIRNEIIFREKQAIVLINNDIRIDYKKRISLLCDLIIKDLVKDHKIQIGISDYFEKITEIADAFEQANHAVIVGSKIQSSSFFEFYVNLGFYIMLYNLSEDIVQIQRIRDKLNIIKEYDKKNNMDYFNTFALMFETDRSADEIAQNAHLHKNTVLYRKKRIMEILGEDPFSMPQKLNYQLYFMMEKMKSEKL